MKMKTQYTKMWNAVKALLRGKLTVVSAHIEKKNKDLKSIIESSILRSQKKSKLNQKEGNKDQSADRTKYCIEKKQNQ